MGKEQMRIFITGIGMITALGPDVRSNFDAVREVRIGMTWSEQRQAMLAPVNLSNQELMDSFGISHNISRTSLLSQHAIDQALQEVDLGVYGSTSLIMGTSVGPVDVIESYYRRYRKGDLDAYEKMTLENGLVASQLAKKFGLNGHINTISTACSSGLNALMFGARLLKHERTDAVIAGACDPFAHFDIEGFKALNIYDSVPCKPFDQNRGGLNLGEGAAFFVLETESGIKRSGNSPLCELSSWSNTADAFHQTASSPEGEGAAMAMNIALKEAGLKPGDISYINAHGTGTPNNDLSESRAFQKVFDEIPPFSSTKGLTGHTLAAAGAVESAFCIQALQEQAVLPNANFEEAMEETGLEPVRKYQPTPIEHVMKNSFGFGGNCSTVIFSKV